MRSFHTPTQKIPHTSKNSPTKFQIFTKILKSSKFPYFSTKITPHQKITHYRTPYRQIPYFTILFRHLSLKNQLKNFHKLTLPSKLSSLFKGIFTMHYFYIKNHHSNHIFQTRNFQTFKQRIIIYPTNQK